MTNLTPNLIDITVPLDVWLRFPDEVDGRPEIDQLAEYEANVFLTEDYLFDVQWYHNDVGLVTHEHFDSYAEAKAWLEGNDYVDFSS